MNPSYFVCVPTALGRGNTVWRTPRALTPQSLRVGGVQASSWETPGELCS